MSKKGRYYKVTKKPLIHQENNHIDMNNQFEEKSYFPYTFSSYMLNNWVAPLWTKFHIGDQLRHGISKPITTWNSTDKDLNAVVNPSTTKGIIGLCNKLKKYV